MNPQKLVQWSWPHSKHSPCFLLINDFWLVPKHFVIHANNCSEISSDHGTMQRGWRWVWTAPPGVFGTCTGKKGPAEMGVQELWDISALLCPSKYSQTHRLFTRLIVWFPFPQLDSVPLNPWRSKCWIIHKTLSSPLHPCSVGTWLTLGSHQCLRFNLSASQGDLSWLTSETRNPLLSVCACVPGRKWTHPYTHTHTRTHFQIMTEIRTLLTIFDIQVNYVHLLKYPIQSV